MSNKTDVALVADTKSGDLDAFAALVQKYEKTVFNAAYRIVGDPDQARDVAQDAFVKSFQKIGDYNPKYKFFSWLYRITINEALNHVNRRDRRRFEEVKPNTIVGKTTPEDAFHQREIGKRIDQALARMEPKYRVMIVLKHIVGCSYREIGSVLELPQKVVKSRLFRARQIMRELLTAEAVQ